MKFCLCLDGDILLQWSKCLGPMHKLIQIHTYSTWSIFRWNIYSKTYNPERVQWWGVVDLVGFITNSWFLLWWLQWFGSTGIKKFLNLIKFLLVVYIGTDLFTSLTADIGEDINWVSSFSSCLVEHFLNSNEKSNKYPPCLLS